PNGQWNEANEDDGQRYSDAIGGGADAAPFYTRHTHKSVRSGGPQQREAGGVGPVGRAAAAMHVVSATQQAGRIDSSSLARDKSGNSRPASRSSCTGAASDASASPNAAVARRT